MRPYNIPYSLPRLLLSVVISSSVLSVSMQARAVDVNVTARIVESTCAMTVSSGAGSAVDLGDWTYVKTESNYQLTPVSGSGVATGSAVATVTIDPACPVLGMSGLTLMSPAPSAVVPSAVTMQGARGITRPASGPNLVILSPNNEAFPIWVDVAGMVSDSSSSAALMCQPGGAATTEGDSSPAWAKSQQAGYNYGRTTELSSGKWSYSAVGAKVALGTYVPLPSAGSSLKAYGFQANKMEDWSPVQVQSLDNAQYYACVVGDIISSSTDRKIGLGANVIAGQEIRNTSWSLRFSGPYTIPLNAWPATPPAAGTQFSGTLTLTMSYL